MFTEYEIETMLDDPEILEATKQLKIEFLKAEARYLEITEHDFFSLAMMTPTIGIAMADGKISIIEEMALNKKARKLSKGGYFMKKDPVIYAMKFLIKSYDKWDQKFYDLLNLAMRNSCKIDQIPAKDIDINVEIDYNTYKKEVLDSPYMLIRFIASFFLENDEDIINKNHKIGAEEYLRLVKVGDGLGLGKVPVFQMFCQTFK